MLLSGRKRILFSSGLEQRATELPCNIQEIYRMAKGFLFSKRREYAIIHTWKTSFSMAHRYQMRTVPTGRASVSRPIILALTTANSLTARMESWKVVE